MVDGQREGGSVKARVSADWGSWNGEGVSVRGKCEGRGYEKGDVGSANRRGVG